MSSTQEKIISRICPQCGRVLEESWVSCPYCGRNLNGRQKQLRITFEIPASIASIRAKLRAVVYWSLYLSFLLVSFLLPLFNPFLTPYCWFLVPVLANFFVGYFVRDVYTAIKIVVVCFLLFPIIVIVLLNIPSVYDAFLYSFEVRERLDYPLLIYPPPYSHIDSWLMILVVGYPIMHILLGITVSFIGIVVRGHIRP